VDFGNAARNRQSKTSATPSCGFYEKGKQQHIKQILKITFILALQELLTTLERTKLQFVDNSASATKFVAPFFEFKGNNGISSVGLKCPVTSVTSDHQSAVEKARLEIVVVTHVCRVEILVGERCA